MDKLVEMYNAQRVAQYTMYGKDPYNLSRDEWMNYVRTMALALTDETHELLRELPWKTWSQRRRGDIDTGAVKAEFADMLHFFLNLMIACGVTPDDLVASYFRKREINDQRMADGYVSSTG